MLVEQIVQWFWWILDRASSDVFCTLLIFIGVLLTVKFVQWLRYNSTLPPGPWGCPIRGYLPYVKGAMHLQYKKLAEKYGTVFSVRFGSDLMVIVSDYRIIHEIFLCEDYTGRPHTDFMNIIDGYGKC